MIGSENILVGKEHFENYVFGLRLSDERTATR